MNRDVFKGLPQATRRPLEAQRDSLRAQRDKFLPEAEKLDDLANNRLGPWKERIDADLAALDEEKARYLASESAHNTRCQPARDDAAWKWCVDDSRRLDGWWSDLKARGDAHNAELERFHLESKPYDARVASISAEIESWEALVNALRDKVDSELKKNTGTCTVEEFDQLDKAVTLLCKQTKWACTYEQSCPVLLQNLNAGKDCYNARKAVMDQCFGGGDRRHQDMLGQVQNGIDNCQRIYREKCGGVGAASELK